MMQLIFLHFAEEIWACPEKLVSGAPITSTCFYRPSVPYTVVISNCVLALDFS